MSKKIYAILVLFVLMTFSCEKLEVDPSGKSSEEFPGSDSDGGFEVYCRDADAVVSAINIKSVVGNEIDYNFVVTNIGGTPLPLASMYFQAYLSTDDIFDSSDAPAGGSIFGDTAPTLPYGGTYTQLWYYHFDKPVNVTEYHFVIVQLGVREDFEVVECSVDNNYRIADIGCNLAEGSITEINITNVDPVANTFDFTFTVANAGWGTLNLSQMYFQAYLSEDEVLGIGEAAAGGSNFGPLAPALGKGETYEKSWYYNFTTPVDITQYRYLIIELGVWDGEVLECSTDNNIAVAQVVIDIPRDGLVAFYPFNNNADDESGNALHGTVNGPTITADRFGYSNKAYSFDGTNDYIAVGNPAQLQITGAITLSVWVKSPTFIYGRTILSKSQCTNMSCTQGHGYILRFVETGSGVQSYGTFIYDPGFGPGGLNFAAGANFEADEWINFTFTLDGTNGTWYKDGVEVFAVTNQQGLNAATLGNFDIGRWNVGAAYFNGLIDDVAVYNRALSATEVMQLFNQNTSL